MASGVAEKGGKIGIGVKTSLEEKIDLLEIEVRKLVATNHELIALVQENNRMVKSNLRKGRQHYAVV